MDTLLIVGIVAVFGIVIALVAYWLLSEKRIRSEIARYRWEKGKDESEEKK